MELGDRHAHKTFVDITGNRGDKINTNEHGKADFPVNGESVSVWIREEAVQLINDHLSR